ncbi:MAG: hypothetical protein IH946_04595 [Bacteroidetes bacterium]|nr:hypothetical protein [Bacteroidota bacterium]
MINTANDFLNKSAFGDSASIYHIEAAIAFEHCTAPHYSDTNREAILAHYDLLMSMSPTPIVQLNRSIAILELYGPAKALDALQSISDGSQLEKYYLYHALKGELHFRQGNGTLAVEVFIKARELTHSKQEKDFLSRRIEQISKAN